MKILFSELMSVSESQSGYKVTVVHVIGEGKIVWLGPKVIVMVSFGRKSLQSAAYKLTRTPRQTTASMRCRSSSREAPPGTGRVEQFAKNNGS